MTQSSPINGASTLNWIRVGLFTLPLYALLTAWSSLEPQPDSAQNPEAWARFVTTPNYFVSHLIGSTGGTILAMFGTFALGAFLTGGRSARLGLAALVVTVAGHALLLIPAALSTFATPALGAAYLAGVQEVLRVEFAPTMMATFLFGLLLAFVGNVLLGVAVWRSGTLPKGAGVLWMVGALVFYVLGVVLGQATTGSSLPTQSIGAVVTAVGGAWIAWSARRQSIRTVHSPA